MRYPGHVTDVAEPDPHADPDAGPSATPGGAAAAEPVIEPVGESAIEPDAWTPVPGVEPPVEVVELDDLDLLAEITHPIRGRVLRRLKDPRTVAEVAELMGVPVTRLYHHVNKLEQAGLVRVVATRRVGAVTERRYQVGACSHRVDRRLFDDADGRELAAALASLFDVAKLGLQREVEAGHFRGFADLEDHAMLSLGELYLSDERRHALVHRLRELVEEFASDRDAADRDATTFTLFVAAYPERS